MASGLQRGLATAALAPRRRTAFATARHRFFHDPGFAGVPAFVLALADLLARRTAVVTPRRPRGHAPSDTPRSQALHGGENPKGCRRQLYRTPRDVL
jgi:hypothetical protein